MRYIILVDAPDEPVTFEGVFARSVERKTLTPCHVVRAERVDERFMTELPGNSNGSGKHP